MRYRMLLSLLLFTLPLQAARPAEEDSYYPQKLTASDLLYACAASSLTSQGRERQRYCRGFISGVEETIRYYGINGSAGGSFCFPQGLTASHYGDVYIKYASRKGTNLARPAVVVVHEAFSEAFSCPARDGRGESP